MALELMSTTHVSVEDLEPSTLKDTTEPLFKIRNRNLFIAANSEVALTSIYEFDGEDLCETGCKALINW